MRNIITLFTATTLLCASFQSSSQAQDLGQKIEINQKDIKITSGEEEKKQKKPTRSYIGLGGVIGISGDDTPLAEGGFSLVGRTAFSKNFSLHNANLFQDDGQNFFAITYGVPIKNKYSDRELLFPFVGGGIAIEDLFGDFEVDPLITTGVDVPIAKRFVGTVRFNITFPEDDTDVGLLLGVGYNFRISDLF